jgi:hypothetical protein
MATIAKEVYEGAPADPSQHSGPTPCSYNTALDTVSISSLSQNFIHALIQVQLVDTFINIAASLKNPRAALASV